MKKILLASLLVTSSLVASSYEYPQLYKDTKTMGMGGAAIAGGGQTSSVFYNTAGLSQIPKEYGWEVDIFNVGVAINENILDFVSDLDDADSGTESEKTTKTMAVVKKYMGENLHFSANVAAITIGKKFDEYSFGFAPFGGVITNFKTHMGFGSEGVLTSEGIGYGGVAFGLSKDMKDIEVGNYVLNNFVVGGGLKSVTYSTWNYDFTLAELLDDDFETDDIAKDGSSTVLDLGMQYDLMPDVKAGFAIQNIGGVGDSEAVEIPMTVGLGLAYTRRYDRVWFNQLTVAGDYIDLFRGYEQDSDYIKRTRFGITGNVIDGWLGTLGMQAGMYQGHATYGFDLRAAIVKIAYSSYAEEVGAYSGQDPDRRHMISISMGW